MTRRSKREIASALDELRPNRQFSIDEYLFTCTKDYYDADLSQDEHQLLESPEEHLTESAIRHLQNLGGSQ